jgi:LAGLIDADG DNA endonuclease family
MHIKNIVYIFYMHNLILRRYISKTLRLDDYKKDYRLTDFPRYLKSVLIGLLLSDGSLERYSITSYPRLNIIMSVKNYSYILHLYNLFEPYINSHINIIDINKNNELNDLKVYSTGRFKTVSLPQLVKYYNLFYKEDKLLK